MALTGLKFHCGMPATEGPPPTQVQSSGPASCGSIHLGVRMDPAAPDFSCTLASPSHQPPSCVAVPLAPVHSILAISHRNLEILALRCNTLPWPRIARESKVRGEPFCPNLMPVIPAPAGSAMSSNQLVRQTSAERGATPIPILHVSSYSSELICLSVSKPHSQEKSQVKMQCTMYCVLPAYDSSSITCMCLARIPDANDLLVPGRSSSLKALVRMQEVRHAQLQYGRHCSHHDTAPIVPHEMNRSAMYTNFRTVQKTHGLRKLLQSFLRTVSLACKTLVAPHLLLTSIVNVCHPARSKALEILLDLVWCMHEHPADNVSPFRAILERDASAFYHWTGRIASCIRIEVAGSIHPAKLLQ
jgi:hypothetical protein